MGTFSVRVKIENPSDRSRSAVVSKILVDTGSEHTWIPRGTLEKLDIDEEKQELFVMANGEEMTRMIGLAIIRYEDYFTIDEVVFAEEDDLLLLGARTLEGLNLTVDPRRRKPVAAGPWPAAGLES